MVHMKTSIHFTLWVLILHWHSSAFVNPDNNNPKPPNSHYRNIVSGLRMFSPIWLRAIEASINSTLIVQSAICYCCFGFNIKSTENATNEEKLQATRTDFSERLLLYNLTWWSLCNSEVKMQQAFLKDNTSYHHKGKQHVLPVCWPWHSTPQLWLSHLALLQFTKILVLSFQEQTVNKLNWETFISREGTNIVTKHNNEDVVKTQQKPKTLLTFSKTRLNH